MIFNQKVAIIDLIKKHFECSDGGEIGENNITYTNNTCREVSRKIREMKNRQQGQQTSKANRSYKPNPADEQQMKVGVWSRHVGFIEEDYFRLIWINPG